MEMILKVAMILSCIIAHGYAKQGNVANEYCGEKCNIGPQIPPVRDGPKGAIGTPCPLSKPGLKGDMGMLTQPLRIGPKSAIEVGIPINLNAKRIDSGIPVRKYIGIKGAIGVPCPLGLKGLKGDSGVMDERSGNGTNGPLSM